MGAASQFRKAKVSEKKQSLYLRKKTYINFTLQHHDTYKVQ